MLAPSNLLPDPRPSVAVVVPAYNAAATLADNLAAIAALTWPADEIVVVDDGSTDRTGGIAIAAGARVFRVADGPRGPAHARNAGVALMRSDYVLFVDADVIIHPNALALLMEDMRGHDAVAAFGCYDETPKSRRATSLYANLRHHYVHRHGRRDAATFWSGIGLIDRAVFLAAGGFDQQRYPRPSIEDVELGARLVRSNHKIRLVPEAQGQHCKDWRATTVWRTDILGRACPWARLIAQREGPSDALNLAQAERVKAAAAVAVLIGLIAGLFWPVALWACVAAALTYLVLNAHFFRYLAQRMPRPALPVAAAMHWLYHVYALIAFVVTVAWVKAFPRRV